MSTKSRALSRRTLLRGTLRGVALGLALPPLEAMFNTSGTAYACEGPIPRRFGLFFWGNGNNPDRWIPSTEGADWAMSEQLAPLAGVKDKFSVVSGLSVKVPNTYPHGSGQAGLLSGHAMQTISGGDTFAGPSIDQIIGEQIGGDTIFRALHTGATRNGGTSYIGPNARNPLETSPMALFERVFGPSFREPGSDAPPDPRLALRRSVLDGVMGDISRLQGQVGAADRARLEQHLEGVRELELRVARLQEDPPSLDACIRPGAPSSDYPDVEGRQPASAVSRAMVDILAMALACDQTRVFGHYFSDPVSDVLYPGVTEAHHLLTHNEGGDQDQVNAVVLQIMAEFGYLVEKLASVPEGDATLLDHCAILAASEVSMGRTHSIDDMPLLVAGNCCGALRMGIHTRSRSGESTSRLMLSLMRAVGYRATSFGSEDNEATEGLSAIEA